MGYRIVYGKRDKRFRRPLKGRKILTITIIACLILFAFGYVFCTAPLIPGEALEHMATAVRGGEKVSDAIVAFCQEIIGNAQMV